MCDIAHIHYACVISHTYTTHVWYRTHTLRMCDIAHIHYACVAYTESRKFDLWACVCVFTFSSSAFAFLTRVLSQTYTTHVWYTPHIHTNIASNTHEYCLTYTPVTPWLVWTWVVSLMNMSRVSYEHESCLLWTWVVSLMNMRQVSYEHETGLLWTWDRSLMNMRQTWDRSPRAWDVQYVLILAYVLCRSQHPHPALTHSYVTRLIHKFICDSSTLIERTPPPPGRFPIYYVPSSRTVSKRTPLEAPGTNSSRGVPLLMVLDEGT